MLYRLTRTHLTPYAVLAVLLVLQLGRRSPRSTSPA